jgi:tetratricopeptide (TPR) repeat protein/predicted Ser/Thr protein kinase
LRELFDEALLLAADARAGFLAERCVDPVLRASVERLLAADAADDALLAGGAEAVSRAIGDADIVQDLPPGSRIGSFELVEVLGEGGSSTVFRACREFEGVRQEVALKLLRHGLYTPDAQRQFRRERQALSQLRHPGIARLIEGGVTDNGLAFIALELVDGKSLTDYSREHRLDLRQRLDLFQQICRAVEAAHRALIVHRDLKPSNVLVTDDGQVKLLDFGIAKLLDSDDAVLTQALAFTPAYAAPEQRSGAPITTATDVYALGILLGELITGQRLTGNTGQTPSSQVKPDAEPGVLPALPHIVRRSLRGDLDNIVLKAIDAEPERRYVSAGALADDIDRLIEGRPVKAHPPSTWYRAQKFVGRHRGGVATTVAFLLAIVTALGIAIWQANVARHEARRANTVRDFVESIFDPLQEGTPANKQPSLRQLLVASVDRLDKAEGLGPRERVDLLLMFAGLNNKIGEPAIGQSLADRASTLAEAELAPNDELTLEALVTRSLDTLYREDYVHAEPELKEAERRLLAAGVGGELLSNLYDGLAKVVNERGDPERALAYERQSLAARITELGADSESVSDGYYNLGYGLEAAGRFDEAVDAYRHAHEIDLKHMAPDSFDLTPALGGEGAAEVYAGHLREGREHLRSALKIADNVGSKPRETQTSFAEQLCFAELTIAPGDAVAACTKATQLDEVLFGVESARYGLVLRLDGMLAMERGDLALARTTFLQSTSLLAASDNAAWGGRTEIVLGELDLIEGRDADAIKVLTSGIQHFGKSYPPHLRRYGLALLALACNAVRSADCAADTFDRADAELSETAYRWNPIVLPANIALARVELAASRAPAAVARLNTAIEHAQSEVDPAQPRLLDARLWLAVAQAGAGQCDIARSGVKATILSVQQNQLTHHPLLAAATKAIGEAKVCGALVR